MSRHQWQFTTVPVSKIVLTIANFDVSFLIYAKRAEPTLFILSQKLIEKHSKLCFYLKKWVHPWLKLSIKKVARNKNIKFVNKSIKTCVRKWKAASASPVQIRWNQKLHPDSHRIA